MPLKISEPSSLKTGIGRRQFIKRSGALAGAAALASAFPAPWIRAAGTIKIGYVSPQTGPLAPFAGADDFVISNVRELFKSQGRDIEVIVKDSQTDSNRAAEVTSDLIQRDKVSLVLVSARRLRPTTRCQTSVSSTRCSTVVLRARRQAR